MTGRAVDILEEHLVAAVLEIAAGTPERREAELLRDGVSAAIRQLEDEEGIDGIRRVVAFAMGAAALARALLQPEGRALFDVNVIERTVTMNKIMYEFVRQAKEE